jgi:hypothetical protein
MSKKYQKKKSYPSCEMETDSNDNRLGDQGYDNIRRLLSGVAQGKLLLSKALDVEFV